MRKCEQELITAIEGLRPDKLEVDDKKVFGQFAMYFAFLGNPNFNGCTLEFLNHPALNKFYMRVKAEESNDFVKHGLLLLRIEDYLMNKNDNNKVEEKLGEIESALKICLEDFTGEKKAQGINMLPEVLSNSEFIRKVYLLNDEKISYLFSKYLPMPRAKVFAGGLVPKLIAQKEQDSTKAIQNILSRLKKENKEFSAFEKGVKKVQRNFRIQRRKREEIKRISSRYQLNAQETIELLFNANKPYIPKCKDRQLVSKILTAAEKLNLFDTVKHFTASTALESIFNDGLFGRKTLQEFYMSYKPAALKKDDIREGDGNANCYGANEIDPASKKNGIELIFDLKKIIQNNPCVFFKQRDLKFNLQKIRNIKIGEIELFFSHTDVFYEKNISANWDKHSTSEFQFFHEKDASKHYAYAAIKNSLLVSYNVKSMHTILALNFFRYVDNLVDKNLQKDEDTINKIYLALDRLDHPSLVKTLQEIGEKLSDTMELNFYGAHQIDFSALLSINRYKYKIGSIEPKLISSLHLPCLVNELNVGNMQALNKAVDEWPEIFNSHRFISYLLAEVKDESVSINLQERLNGCDVPSWISYQKN